MNRDRTTELSQSTLRESRVERPERRDGRETRETRERPGAERQERHTDAFAADIQTVISDAKKAEKLISQLDDGNSDEISRLLENGRSLLNRIRSDTKRAPQAHRNARTAQTASAARALVAAARGFEAAQEQVTLLVTQKKKFAETKIRREIRIANPNATQNDIEQAVHSQSPVFAQQLMGPDRKRALTDLQNRQNELAKIEASVEQLAQLFIDMQALLETQQETISVIHTQAEDSARYMEQGGREMTLAIKSRVNSRRRAWIFGGVFLVILIILAAVIYFQRCPWLQIQCPVAAVPTPTK